MIGSKNVRGVPQPHRGGRIPAPQPPTHQRFRAAERSWPAPSARAVRRRAATEKKD